MGERASMQQSVEHFVRKFVFEKFWFFFWKFWFFFWKLWKGQIWKLWKGQIWKLWKGQIWKFWKRQICSFLGWSWKIQEECGRSREKTDQDCGELPPSRRH